METITKKIREKIYNELINNHYISLDIKNNNIVLLALMFDYYNALYCRQKSGDINGWDMQFIKMLESSSFSNLFKLFKSNSYFIEQSLKDNYVFNSLTTIEKQNLMYELHFNSEKNNITNNYLYILDMLGYMPFDNLSDLETGFHEVVIKLNNLDTYMEELLFNLDSLKEINYDKYKEIKLEIIYSFYKLDKYRLKVTKNKEIKNRLYHFLIEHLSNDNIIKFSEKNSNFEYEVFKLYFSSKEFFPKFTYNQIITESEKDMPKKLIKKFNNNKKEN